MEKPDILEITFIALLGGLLGVFFMVPLRNALIVKEHGVLPYPEGTDMLTHNFRISHMFTQDSERLGIKAGETEDLEPVELLEGLQVTLTGLSPVTVGWTMAPVDTSTLPVTGDASNLLGWLALLGASLTGLKMRRKK